MEFKQAFYKEYRYYPNFVERADPQVISRLYKIDKKNIQLTKLELEQSRVLRFFPVMKEGETLYYGGNQKWYSRETQKEGGCAPVATANILACLAAQDEKVAEKLNLCITKNSEETISKKDYTMLMHRVYNNMEMLEIPFLNKRADEGKNTEKLPSTLGCDATGFLKGTLAFAARNGIALKPHIYLANYADAQKSLHFVEKAIRRGAPVIMLTTHNKHNLWSYSERSMRLSNKEWDAARSHFMTIVGVRRSDEGTQLIVSSWGRLFIVDFAELAESWQNFSAMGAGLFYFTQESSLEKSKKAALMANSYLPATMVKTFVGTTQKAVRNIEKKIKKK